MIEQLENVAAKERLQGNNLEMSKSQIEYLNEFVYPEKEWTSMSEYDQRIASSNLCERIHELETEYGCSKDEIRKKIPPYQLESVDSISFTGTVKYVSDVKWQRYGPDGYHQDNGYERAICAHMKGGNLQCYLTEDIRNCYKVQRISESKVATVEELLKGKEVECHYDPIKECYVLTGGLEQYLPNYESKSIEYLRVQEAPQDYEQISRISELMASTDEFKSQNWEILSLTERIDVLNNLEKDVAKIECRPSCPIRVEDMGSITIYEDSVYGYLGGYSPVSKDISINKDLVASNNPVALREILDTVIHEGRHAYQDYNVNEIEVHPRHSEVTSWAETMEGGKWGYYGDSSTLIGQRLYEQQSVEIDARNFAGDILDKFEQYQIA